MPNTVVDCTCCGELTEKSKSALRRVNDPFCSPECYHKYQKENFSLSVEQEEIHDYLEENGLSFNREIAESLGCPLKKVRKKVRRLCSKGVVKRVVQGPHLIRYDLAWRRDSSE